MGARIQRMNELLSQYRVRSDTVLFQQASGTHIPLLKLTQDHHRNYCEFMGMDYFCLFGRTTNWPPYWEKLFIARMLDYKYVIYLDADTVIVDTKVDFRKVIIKPLMMVRHPAGKYGGRDGHYNCGVYFMEKTDGIRNLIEETISPGPGTPDWWEQTIINQLLVLPWYCDLVGELPAQYNATVGVNECVNPVIRACHGPCGDMIQKARMIEQWLKS